jgi:hypothetical protein
MLLVMGVLLQRWGRRGQVRVGLEVRRGVRRRRVRVGRRGVLGGPRRELDGWIVWGLLGVWWFWGWRLVLWCCRDFGLKKERAILMFII